MTYTPPPFEEFAQEEQQKRALVLCKKARKLSENELFEEALKLANQAVELAPDAETESECQIEKGADLMSLHKFDDALIAMQRAVDLTPEHARVHLFLGYALEVSGEWTKALTEFEKASRLKKLEEDKLDEEREDDTVNKKSDLFDFASLCDRIYPHLSEAELKSQIETLGSKLTAKASDQLQTKLWYAYLSLIKKLGAPGASEEAIDYVNRVLKVAPLLGSETEIRKAVAYAYEHWARLCADKKDYDAALTYNEKASNLHPDPDKSEYEAKRLLWLPPSGKDVDSWIRELANFPQDDLKKIAKYWADWGVWPDAHQDAILSLFQFAVTTLQEDREASVEWFARMPEENKKYFIELFRKLKPDFEWPPAKHI